PNHPSEQTGQQPQWKRPFFRLETTSAIRQKRRRPILGTARRVRGSQEANAAGAETLLVLRLCHASPANGADTARHPDEAARSVLRQRDVSKPQRSAQQIPLLSFSLVASSPAERQGGNRGHQPGTARQYRAYCAP